MKRFTVKAAIIAAAAVICLISSCAGTRTISSEEDVLSFLTDKGIAVTGDCTHKTVTIPQEFGEVYERYNELQKQSGYDLSRYRSREAEVYTFPTPDGSEVHVIVCDNAVIGGDIASLALDGEMRPL